MQKDKHPKYRDVLFVDSSTGHRFVCGSALQTKETEMHEGKEMPVYYVSVSAASHPYFTGSSKFVDAEGRVDKFKKRYEKAQQPKPQPAKVQTSKPPAAVSKAKKAAK